jgi:hypothetical protein
MRIEGRLSSLRLQNLRQDELKITRVERDCHGPTPNRSILRRIARGKYQEPNGITSGAKDIR